MVDVAGLGVASSAFATTGGPPCPTVWAIPDDETMLGQIAAMLQRLCDHNSNHSGACPTIFDSAAPPLLLPSVHCFLVRLHRHTEFDSVCYPRRLTLPYPSTLNPTPTYPYPTPTQVNYLVALSHIMRLDMRLRLSEAHGPALRPTRHNIHRLFIAALVVASKTNDGEGLVSEGPRTHRAPSSTTCTPPTNHTCTPPPVCRQPRVPTSRNAHSPCAGLCPPLSLTLSHPLRSRRHLPPEPLHGQVRRHLQRRAEQARGRPVRAAAVGPGRAARRAHRPHQSADGRLHL